MLCALFREGSSEEGEGMEPCWCRLRVERPREEYHEEACGGIQARTAAWNKLPAGP